MKKVKNYFVGAIVGFINGFFASGGGIVAVLALKRYMKLDETRAHATAISVILPLTLCGIFVYGSSGYADINMIIKTASGGIIGAVIGAKALKRLPKKYIKAGFGAVMIVSAVRMFF